MSSGSGAPQEPDSVVAGEESGGLTMPPRLVKVDRYGSVSGLVRVRMPLGFIVIEYRDTDVGGSFGS